MNREGAAEVIRGAVFGILVVVMTVAGWGSHFYLLLGAAFAALIMYRKLWARIVPGIFIFAAVPLNFHEHRPAIAALLIAQLVVLAMPNRVIRFVLLENH